MLVSRHFPAFGLSTAIYLTLSIPYCSAETLEIGADFPDGSQVQSFQPIGQSFTAPGSPVYSFGFRLFPINPVAGVAPLSFSLFAGEGTAGPLLLTRTVTPPAGLNGYFDLDLSGVTLTPGSVYTVVLTTTNSYWGLYAVGSGNPYSGGHLYAQNPFFPVENGDAAFRLRYQGHQGDFNGDGYPDILWQNDATREVLSWYLGGQSGTTVIGFVSLTNGAVPGWTVVGTADFNTDGKPDLVWQNDSTRDLQVWYMGGAAGNVYQGGASLSGGPVPGWRCVGTGDFNKDGKPDLLWQNEGSRELHIWYMGGSRGDQYLGGGTLSGGPVPGWTVAGAADFNGDDRMDIVWQNDSTRELYVWYMGGGAGNTYLGSAMLSAPVPGWTVVGTNDFNRDGKPDVVWQNDASRDTHIWFLGGALGNSFLGSVSVSNGPIPGWTAIE